MKRGDLVFWGDVVLRGGLALAFAIACPTALAERAYFPFAALTLATLAFVSDVAKAVTAERGTP